MRKYTRRMCVAGTILIAGAAVTVGSEAAQQFALDWFTVDSGGAMRSPGGDFELSGSIGQPDAGGPLTGGQFALIGGFWFGLAPDDCNSDGGVDLYDYYDFQACLAGPDSDPGQAYCPCFDMDGDRDIDLVDFAEFQAFFQDP